MRRIAVVRANALGDYLFSLPALDALRASYPSAEIVLLGAPWHERFLDERPGPVDRVLVAPALPGIREPVPDDPVPAERADEFLAKARAEGFDLALQLHGGGRHANPFVSALGAGLTAGLRATDAPPLDRWIRYVPYQPEVARYLEVVGLVGAEPVPERSQPTLALTPADEAEAAAVRPPGGAPLVALHPGATDPRRRWMPERFAAVGDAAASAGAEVIVTGSAVEQPLIDGVLAGMRAPSSSLAGALSIGGLAALYARCAAVVANDTGPLHLAVAAGAPTVGLFRIGNLINRATPTRRRHRAIPSWTIHCPECGGDGCDHQVSYLGDIRVAEVVDDVLDILDVR